MKEKKYFWLKLNKDFFKQHEIRIIEEMENGKDYILFYLKLLLESITHEGNLRFNDTIPYNDKMLSTITNTNIDIVRSAIKVFNELNLMEILDDGTIYMTETTKMIGQETKWAKYKRIERKTNDLEIVQNLSNRDRDRDRDRVRDKSIELDIDISKFKKPTLKEIETYCKERKNNIDAERFYNFYESKGWMIGKNKMKDWKACIRTWEQKQDGQPLPEWYGKNIKKESMTKEEEQELQEMIKEFE